LKGLSCLKGNFHEQFLGGLVGAIPPGYPATVLTLPSSWVHPSQGPTGMWCFIPTATTGGQPGAYVDSQGRTRAIPPQTPTRENTRCAFFVSIN
jgi:hypothetical protein